MEVLFTKKNMPEKIYRLNTNKIKSQMCFTVEDEVHVVVFDGGTLSPRFIAGRCTIRNKALQDAMEASPAFDNEYSLEYSEADQPVVEEKPVVPEQKEDKAFAVVSLETAKQYLVEKYGINKNKLPNKRAILNFAKDKNVVFPYWN